MHITPAYTNVNCIQYFMVIKQINIFLYVILMLYILGYKIIKHNSCVITADLYFFVVQSYLFCLSNICSIGSLSSIPYPLGLVLLVPISTDVGTDLASIL